DFTRIAGSRLGLQHPGVSPSETTMTSSSAGRVAANRTEPAALAEDERPGAMGASRAGGRLPAVASRRRSFGGCGGRTGDRRHLGLRSGELVFYFEGTLEENECSSQRPVAPVSSDAPAAPPPTTMRAGAPMTLLRI